MAAPLQDNGPTLFEFEPLRKGFHHGFGNLNLVRKPLGLKTAGNVYRIAPDVIDELVPPDDASDYRAGMDADTHL